MPEVVVIGNVGVDTLVLGAGNITGAESRFTENRDVIGQAGGYCARGFSRLGSNTAFIGHVGVDPWGDWIRTTLNNEGIDTRALWRDPAGTARSINIMDTEGGRINFYDGKGHMDLSPDLDLCKSVITGSRLCHFHLANWSRQLLSLARQANAVVSCDLQDVEVIDDPYRRDFVEQADILFVSAANFPDPRPYVDYCFNAGPARAVIVGMGKKGCILATRDAYKTFDPIPMATPVTDSNGAGDGLAVGFLWAHVLQEMGLGRSIIHGLANARFTCTLQNGSNQLCTREQLEKLVDGVLSLWI